jgi:hypothetical protein
MRNQHWTIEMSCWSKSTRKFHFSTLFVSIKPQISHIDSSSTNFTICPLSFRFGDCRLTNLSRMFPIPNRNSHCSDRYEYEREHESECGHRSWSNLSFSSSRSRLQSIQWLTVWTKGQSNSSVFQRDVTSSGCLNWTPNHTQSCMHGWFPWIIY